MMNHQDTSKKRLVFIGAGNMAEALVKGVVRSGRWSADRVAVTDVRPERRDYFHTTFGVTAIDDNPAAVSGADVVVLAVKPQVMDDVLAEVAGKLPARALVISIAAGIRTGRIEQALGKETRVVRVMPNTPALVGAGAAAICAGAAAGPDDLGLAEELLDAVGLVVRVEEDDMDAVTALSGSGPAYVFYLVEALLDAAAKMGLAEKPARDLAVATVKGAAVLLEESGESPAVLRERVTSKGGTTAAALAVMRERALSDIIVDALLAARQRSRELSGA